MTTTKTLNVCTNKGHSRVWIEGNALADNNWSSGDRFNKSLANGVYTLTRDTNGQHKISGTKQRPIIDLCGKYMTEFFAGAQQYTVTIKTNSITIERG